MKKVNEMLAVLLVSLSAVLVAAIGLRVYNAYVISGQIKQERQMQEEVLTRNREANDRVLEMRQEIQELSKDRERLKQFLEEIQTVQAEAVIPVLNMVDEGGMSGDLSALEMTSLSEDMTNMSMNMANMSENTISGAEFALSMSENTTDTSWNMTNMSDNMISLSGNMTSISENALPIFWNGTESGNGLSESGNGTESGNGLSWSENSTESGNGLSQPGNGTESGNGLSWSGNSTESGNGLSQPGNGMESGNGLSWSENSTESGNGLSQSGNGMESDNGLSESGNGTESGNRLSWSGNGTESGNGLSESGSGAESGNGLSAPGDMPGLVLPEISLEERRKSRSSLEETLLTDEENLAFLAGREDAFAGKKIACLGDSITAAANLEGQENYPDCSYPSVLQELLGAEEVYNLGIGGSTIGRYWSNPFVERYQEIPQDTDVIIVMGGSNDSFCLSEREFGTLTERKPWTFCGDLDELMRGLREHYPSAQIYFVTPLPNILQDYLMRERSYLLPQQDLVNVILTLAAEYDYTVIDLYNSNLLDSHDADIVADYIPDGVHANEAGYRILARHIAAQLLRHEEERGEGRADSLQ